MVREIFIFMQKREALESACLENLGHVPGQSDWEDTGAGVGWGGWCCCLTNQPPPSPELPCWLNSTVVALRARVAGVT